MTDLHAKILRILSVHGRENPISWQELAGQLSLQGVAICARGLRRETAVLREEGYMILYTTGYWIATSEEDCEEIERVAHKLYEHADSERDAADQLTHWAHRLNGIARRESRLAEQGRLAL